VIGKTVKELGLFAGGDDLSRFVSTLQEKHSVQGMELRCRSKAGEIRTCRFSSSTILIDDRPHILSTIEDITEHKRAQEAIRETGERYRLILENASDGILVNELTPRGPGKFIDANESACRILGMTREELQGVSLIDLDTPEMQKRAPELIQKLLQTKRVVFQTGYVAKDNREKILDVTTSLFDLNGQPTMLTVVRDVTEIKAAESALNALVAGMVGATGRESLDRITESINTWLGADCVMIGEITPDHERVRVLSMLLDGEKIPEYSYPLKGTPCEDAAKNGFCNHPDSAAWLFPENRDLCVSNIRGYAGTVLHNPEGQAVGFLCIFSRTPLDLPPSAREIIDIIAAKAAAEIGRLHALSALSESEEKYRNLVENSIDAVLFAAPDGTIFSANPEACRIFGMTEEELLGAGWDGIVDYTDPRLAPALEERARTGRFKGELRFRRRDGTTFPAEISSALFADRNGCIRVTTIIRDVTERVAAAEALRQSEELLALVMDGVPTLLSYLDTELRFVYINKAHAVWYGRTKDELIGRSIRDLLPKDVFRRAASKYEAVLEGQEVAFESLNRDLDGREHIFAVHLVPHIQDGKVIGIFSALHDITRRKRAEEALKQANKKLNLLSGITRHDINNQLQILEGYLELLRERNSDPVSDDYLSRISIASSRISSMIQFMKEYEEIGVGLPVWQGIRSLVDDAGRSASLSRITLENAIPADLEVFADPLISKVFFNLIDNALRYGGKATRVRFMSEVRDGSCIIVCEDDGDGVPVNEKEKIFARGVGKNTGFGLSLSREILDITGIAIRETGEAGRGARFEIVIPKGQFRVDPA